MAREKVERTSGLLRRGCRDFYETINMHGWFIYMVRRDDGSLYTGITTDVRRRLIQHKRGGKYGSKYLRGHTPLKLVLRRKIGGKGLALKVEIAIKKMSKTEKEAIVKNKKILNHIIRSAVQL